MNVDTFKWRRGGADSELVVVDDATAARRRRNLIIGIVVAVLALVLAALLFARGSGDAGSETKVAVNAKGKGGGRGAPSVTVVVPGRQQVAKVISATGTLAARRDMPVGVAGEGGMVVRVLAEPGQWVGAGQTLAVIERSVQSQQAQQLAAQIEVARADARLTQSELDRALSLVSRGFVSKADVERKRAARDAANARVRVAQAQLGETRARIGRLDIRAPAAGLVLDRNLEPGQVVGGGSGALFRIAMGGQLELLARLAQQDLEQISVGVPVSVTPVGSSRSFQGSIWQISPIIDPATRQGEARIAIPYDPALRPGGFASAQIKAGAVDAPLLPQSAVMSDEKGNYVYVVNGRNEIERRDVQVGSVSSQGVTVAAGLSGQERIVLSAGAFLNPGQKVTPRRATR
ncbi:MAG TPA: efflux RND transporter periplasmic adaptor subunit [Allosphingosinicella sp.]|jgi:RND family efflux transporter MFP subunit